MTCPACSRPVAEGTGQVMQSSDGRAWIICAACARTGDVRIGDVEHAPPAFGRGA